MSDNTLAWLELLRQLDAMARQREREKLEAMTDEEREKYEVAQMIQSMVNMP